jgi:hypothetical protein
MRPLALVMTILAAAGPTSAQTISLAAHRAPTELAQNPQPEPSAKKALQDQEVLVHLVGTTSAVRGRLVALDATRVTIKIPDSTHEGATAPATVSYSLDQVRHIDEAKSDSVIGSAIVGAIFVAACARWWCQQGGDGASGIDGGGPKDLVFGAAYGALIFAGIDAAFAHHTRIYEAPIARASKSLPRAMLAARFTF